MTKPTKWHVRPGKSQISLGIRQLQSDQSLHCPHEESLGPKLPIMQTAKTLIRQILSLHWTHSHFVGFVMRWLISHYFYTSLMKIQQIKKFCSIKEQPCTSRKLFFHMHKQMLICWVIWNECCFCNLSTDFLNDAKICFAFKVSWWLPSWHTIHVLGVTSRCYPDICACVTNENYFEQNSKILSWS